jgi:cobalt-precorrin-5B (C1)-methyltransferase
MTASRFNLQQLAENGLKRGFTTGTCATAAVKAALLKLVCNETPDEVDVTLADGARYVTIPIDRICLEENGAVRADVIKDAGDDPDQTHRARIFARVQRNTSGDIVFLRGEGVGVVTQPGLQIGIGEPAINPEPRRMMLCAVRELLDELSTRDSASKAAFRSSAPPESWNQNRWRRFRLPLKFTFVSHLAGTRMKSCLRLAISASASREALSSSR